MVDEKYGRMMWWLGIGGEIRKKGLVMSENG
jgi:hypothetical protein